MYRLPRQRSHGPALWRVWLARVGNVSADAAYNRGSSYSRLLGSPDFLYLFGFTNNPGLYGPRARVSEAFGDQIGTNTDWRAAGRTRVNLGFGTYVNTQAEFTSRRAETNGVEQRNDSSRFPDLSFEYGKIADVIRLSKLLVNPQLRTAYNRDRQSLFQSGDQPTSISTASQWQPLLSLQGSLKNGSRLELGIERRNTQRQNFVGGQSITNDRQTTINFSLNRQYTQGQRVNLLGKTTARSGSFERHSGETAVLGQDGGVRNPTSEDRLNVQSNGSYGFSDNVTGTATLGFQQNRDLARSIVRRSIRVELRGSFTF